MSGEPQNENVVFEWNGEKYDSFAGLGRKMLESLWLKDVRAAVSYSEMMNRRAVSAAMETSEFNYSGQRRRIKMYEELFNRENTWRNRAKCLYAAAYALSGNYYLYIGENTFRNTEELCAYCDDLLAQSYDSFRQFAEKLFMPDGKPDVQFEAWLAALRADCC